MSDANLARSVARAGFIAAGLVLANACSSSLAPTPSPDVSFGVRRIAPNLGATFAPTVATIIGAGFTAETRILVDGTDIAGTLVNDSAITVTMPPHAAGSVRIVVTNGVDKPESVPNGFKYVAPSPVTLTNLSPDHVLAGGTFLISGTGFVTGVRVTVGGAAAVATLRDSTTLSVTAPAHNPGDVDVVITNPYTESVSLQQALTYSPLPPLELDHAEPFSGSTAGGTLLAIFGSSFQAGAIVTIDGTIVPVEIGEAGSIYFGSVYFETPAHAEGPVDIVVTNPDGQSRRLDAGFTYMSPHAFSFSGTWYTYMRPDWRDNAGFEVQNGVVTRLFCGYEVVNLIPTPLPVVTDGTFSFAAKGGGQITGRIVANGQATGTSSIPGCGSGNWYGYRANR